MATSIGFGQAAPDKASRDPPSRHRFADGSAAVRACFVPVEGEGALSSLIESEIIPRLMVSNACGTHDRVTFDDGRDDGAGITAMEIADLAPLALQVEADELIDYADRILRRGVPVTSVLVDLLAPAARMLGEYWKEDRCDFVDVTMGLWRLQEVVHEVAGRVRSVPGGRRALFAAMPGDQHSFGTVVIDEVFCRDGWVTDRLGAAATPELLDRAAESWFDLVGLTVSCDSHIEDLPALITALRSVSRNPQVRVMVGGRVFVENPALACELGADGTAADARLALAMAAKLVDAAEREMALPG